MAWIEHHRVSEQCASQAEACLREGSAEEARGHYARSAEAEERALGELELSKTKTYGITAVSTASLYFKARRLADAERVAIDSMGFDQLPPFAQRQLHNIVQVVWAESLPFTLGSRRSLASADVRGPATLRGFSVSLADVGNRVRLCHPLLSFEDGPLYVANRLDWENDLEALTVADPYEASALGTLLPPVCSMSIASGQGVIAVGAGFVQNAAKAEIIVGSEIRLSQMRGLACLVGVAPPVLYAALRTRLRDEAREAFGDVPGDAASYGSGLSDRRNAVRFVMRNCGLGPDDESANRQLAGAVQNKQADLYQLIKFASERDARALDEHPRWIASVYGLTRGSNKKLPRTMGVVPHRAKNPHESERRLPSALQA